MPKQRYLNKLSGDKEPSRDPEPLTNTMLTNPWGAESKGLAMAKPTPLDGNQKK